MTKDNSLVCRANAQYPHFLTSITRSQKGDPCLVAIVQMIAEENNPCHTQKPNDLNLELVRKLNELVYVYDV